MLEVVEDTGEFVIHHSDGGFRRFSMDPQRGWEAADGAEELILKMGPDTGSLEFNVGGDRYVVAITDLPGHLTDG